MTSKTSLPNDLRLFRGLWLLVTLAALFSFLISWRTGTPPDWQPLFLGSAACMALAASCVMLGFDRGRLQSIRQKIFWLRSHDGLMFLVVFCLLAVMLLASAALYLYYLTYIAVTPVLLGGSLLLVLIVGSSQRWLDVLELVAKSFLALISLGLMLVVVDTGVSAYYRRIPYWANDSVSERAEHVGWRNRPKLNLKNGEFTTNSLGYRTPYEPDEIPPDALVIGLQGDSQLEAFAAAADQTFEHYLEGCLAQNLDVPVRVINFGVRGYDLNNYLAQAPIITQQYDLDWLVMLFNSHNDYDRALLKAVYGAYRPFWVLEDGQLKETALPEPFALQIYPVEFQDAFAQFNDKLQYNRDTQFSIDPESPLAGSWLYITLSRQWYEAHRPLEFSQTELDDNKFYIDGYWKFTNPIPEPFSTYQPTFERIMQQWKTYALHTAVLVLPDRREILWEEEMQAQVQAVFQRRGLAAPEPTVFLNWIDGIIEELGIPVIDFYASLMPHPDRLSLFLPRDSHLSPLGYQVTAETACQALLPYLVEKQNQ